MELSDYLAALRRRWVIWVGATLAGALVGLLVFAQTPKTYEATATLFVSVSPTIPNSASFVQQRVKSYPDIVTSEAVLAPVVTSLDLEESLADLRARVSASNPADTTQLRVTVSGADPEMDAAIANEVAGRFADVVETLETPSVGDGPVNLTVGPVNLTVADPAVAPTSPAAPVLPFLLALGFAVGLLLGLAGALVRDRMDTALHTGEDLRRAWDGTDPATELLVPPAGRGGRSALTGRAAVMLSRRLEQRAEAGPVPVVLVSPSPSELRSTRSFAEQVAANLRDRGLDVAVTDLESARTLPAGSARIRLAVADPLAPPRTWQHVAEHYDGVVVVVDSGRVDGQELREMRSILGTADVPPLAVALVPRRRARWLRAAAAAVLGRRSRGVAVPASVPPVRKVPVATGPERS